MKHPDYFTLMKKALCDLRDHPVVFMPFVFGIILFILFGFFVFFEGFLLLVLFNIGLPNLLTSLMASGLLVASVAVFVFIDILLAIIFASYISAMVYSGFYYIAANKRITLDTLRRGASRLFPKVFRLFLIRFALYFIPFIVFGGITAAASVINWFMGLVAGIMFLMLYVIYAIYISFGLFFIGPMIAYKRKGVMDILKDSFKYLHTRTSHVVLTWLVVVCINIFIALVLTIAMLPLQVVVMFMPLAALLTVSVRIFVNLVLTVYSSSFAFKSYFTVNKAKK